MPPQFGWHAIIVVIVLVGALTTTAQATKPPSGYVEPPRPVDPHPPRYAYGYAVGSNGANATDGGGGGGQGHRESRDGDNTHGNYYVNFANGEAQASVEYVADDWGYHPIVRYSSHDDHSRVSSHFALGESAVERLRGEPAQQTLKLLHAPQQSVGNLVQVIPMLEYVQPNLSGGLPNGPLQYNPEQLQIIGVIPQEHPKFSHGLPTEKTTIIYPVAPNYPSAGDNHVPSYVENVESKQNSESSELLDKTKSLINGFDVIDINHSAEAVAQNSLFQVASEEDQYNAASDGQREAVLKQENEAAEAAKNDVKSGFSTPIVVDDQPHPTSESPEVSIKPNRARFTPELAKQPKQINLQIFDNNHDEYPKESTLVSDHDVDDDIRIPEAPSRQFVHGFNGPESSTSPTISSDYDVVPPNEPVTPVINPEPFENHEPVTNPQTIFRVNKELDIKSVLLDEKTHTPTPSPVYGTHITHNAEEPITYVTSERSEPILYHHANPTVEIQQQIIIPYPAENHVEKSNGHRSAESLSIEQIVNDHIDNPSESGRSAELHTNVVDNLSIEKYIDRPVPYPVPVEKIVNRPYPVERIVEKIVERPVERIVEKEVRVPFPVHQIVEKIVERPVEKIVDRPVPFPYPVEVKQYVDRPYEVERVVEKEAPNPYPNAQAANGKTIADSPVPVEPIAENYVQNPPPPPAAEQIINHPYPVEIKLPVGIPYAVQVPIHLPLTYQQALVPLYSPPNHNYLPPFQPLPPQHSAAPNHPHSTKAFYFKNTLDHIYQPQPGPPPSHYQHQHHNAGKHTLLPHLNTLPAHLHHYQQGYAGKHNSVPGHHPASFHASTTRLHPIRPHHYGSSAAPVRPVYGVPTHQATLPAAPNAAAPLLANYRNQHSYAGSFGYAPHVVYRDEYFGPPPPPPGASDQHGQSTWTSYAVRAPSIAASSGGHQRPLAASSEGELVASASIQSSTQLRSPNALAAPQSAQVSEHRRNLNFGKSMRWENGFRPPLVPSVQTDEHGVPLDLNGGQ